MTTNEILAYATAFRTALIKDQLGDRMCVVVSGPLAAALVVMGEAATMRLVDQADSNHAFIDLGNGLVLDPTADQFGMAPVYLGPPTAVHAGAKRHADADIWLELMVQFRRFVPSFEAEHVGGMARTILETMPREMTGLAI